MRLILPPYNPNPSQRAFHKSPALNRLYLSGVGGGKTYAVVRELVSMVFRCRPGALHLIGGPSFRVIDSSIWPELCGFLDTVKNLNGFGLDRRRWTAPGNRQIEMINGSRILVATLSDPSRFAGASLAGFVLDEGALLGPEASLAAWNVLCQRRRDPLSPILYGIVATTPRGPGGVVGHFTQQCASGNPNFDIIRGTSFDNVHLPDGYLDSVACGISASEYDQQVMGRLVDTSGGLVYPEFDAIASLDPSWQFTTHRRKTYVAIDWGPSMPAAIWIQTCEDGRSVVFDEIAEDQISHRHLIAQVEEKTKEWGISVHDLTAIHADPNPSEAVNDLRRRTKGVPVYAPRGKFIQNINRGIDVLKGLLLDWQGNRRLYFAPRLQQTKTDRGMLASMQHYRWRERKTPDGYTVFDDVASKGKHDHHADALRYWAAWHFGRYDRDYKKIPETQPTA